MNLKMEVMESRLEQEVVCRDFGYSENKKSSEDGDEILLDGLIKQYHQYKQARDRKQIILMIISVSAILAILSGYGFYVFNTQRDYVNIETVKIEPLPVIHNKPIKSDVTQALINQKNIREKEFKADRINKGVNKKTPRKNHQQKKKNRNIRLTDKDNRVNPILHLAYEQYQNKAYEASLENYQKALLLDKNNRDIWMGLAANYRRLGKTEKAKKAYRELLKRDPHDDYARAGLLMLDSYMPVSVQEENFKKLIGKNPDEAALYSGLGQLYAMRKQWGDARQAYYSAWALDKTSANALNLAISLEHMGKGKAAMKFYELSLSLDQEGNPNKNRLKKHIQMLKEQHNEYTGKKH